MEVKTHYKGFEALGVDLNTVTRNGHTTCPFCSHDRKKKKAKCFFVDVKTGNWLCHNCGREGRVDSDQWIEQNGGEVDAAKNHFRRLDLSTERHKYDRPRGQIKPITEEALAYLKGRGISEATVKRNMIGCNGSGHITFPYYHKKTLIAAKYWRIDPDEIKTSGKAYQAPNCKPVIFKVNDIMESDFVVITEGEIDALSFEEAGIPEAVSVDKGTVKPGQKLGKKLECLKMCQRYLVNKDVIYVAVDKDEQGKVLEDALVNRYGKDRVRVIDYPAGCNDPNQVLKDHGPEVLRKCFDNAKAVPLEDVFRAGDVWEDIEEAYEKGVERGEPSHFDEMNKNFSWITSFLYLWSGIPNHGKSTFLMFLMLLKSAHDGAKWAVFSPEHSPAADFFREVICMFVGKSFDKNSPNHMSLEELRATKEFINNHFIFIYPQENEEVESPKDVLQTPQWIYDKIRELAAVEGISGFVIDPWNQLDHIFGDTGREDQYLSHWLKQFKRVAQLHGLYANIVAHPKDPRGRKRDDEEERPCPDVYDISGGSMWNNKVDAAIFVHRPFFHVDPSDRTVHVVVKKAKKQRRFGEPGKVEIEFDPRTQWYKGLYGDESPLKGIFELVTRLGFDSKKPGPASSENSEPASVSDKGEVEASQVVKWQSAASMAEHRPGADEDLAF